MIKAIRLSILAAMLMMSAVASASIYQDTIYINRDTLTTAGYQFHFCAFNFDTIFDVTNAIIELNSTDTVDLTVVNRDTVDHTFTIDGYITTGNTITPGSDLTFTVSPPTLGTFRYYSESPMGELLGASGIIVKGYENYARYQWNLFDQEDTVAMDIANGAITAMPADYHPQMFSINGHTFPQTNSDTAAFVTGNVGDTIVISIVNSGSMKHSIHFHGYHATILEAKVGSFMNGWSKDSWPVQEGEAMTIWFIADQDGIYPVHDHNLIAVTTAGVYPGGMIISLNISP